MKNEELRCRFATISILIVFPVSVIARLRRSRGNPYSVQEVHTRTNCQKNGLPRRLRLLAMTEEIEAQAQTIDHICHCEAPKGPWQSHGTDLRNISAERYFPEISGLALSLCPALRLCKGKCLPSRCGRLTPPQAALPCGPRRPVASSQ